MSDDEYGGDYGDDDGGGYDEYGGGDGGDYYEPEEDEGGEYEQEESEEEQPEEEGDHGESEAEQRDQPPSDEETQGYHDHNYGAVEESFETANTTADDSGSQHAAINFEGLVKGALDGFGGGSISDIMGTIGNITGGDGGLTNILASGGLAAMASGLIATAAHRFLNVNPETGQLIGAIAGNLIFKMGGQNNSLSDIGKIVLDNIVSGKFRRKVDPFVPPVHTGLPSFNLDFYSERDRCLREQRLFEDPEFPPQDSSLYYSERPKRHIEWLRPGEITSDPQLIGALGDCWLLAAAANLTLRDELFYRVVPPDQSFTENYAGIFHFQFWRYGKWVDVVIDDRLPTANGELVYMHSDKHNEFWSALLEKAYAKLYGSYEALKGGSTAEAMEDFTGGLIEYFTLKEVQKEHLLAVLVRGFQMGSLFGCSIAADPNITEAVMENGLVRGHAYSITALQKVHGPHGETVLLRVRNPWGNDTEWNGAWSDGAHEWSYLASDQKQQMDVVSREDGEFWMSFDDFYHNFEEMENCNLGPDVMDEISQMTGVEAAREATAWTNFETDGAWSSRNGTAGGCRNYIESFANNPQYGAYFSLGQGSVEADGKCTIITAVLQKYRRELRREGLDSLPIGFVVYENAQGHGRLDRSFFEHSRPVAKNPTFINLREVTARFRLPPGNYVVVPSTFDPDDDAEFLLRMYCSGQVQAQQIG